MSLGYADRLSYREDLGGRLGAPELTDPPHVALDKAEQLAGLVQAAGRVVAYTGAGISTSCGIPDFRGPNGVWTAQRKGLPMPRAKVSFLYAQPSLTHMALLGLMQHGRLAYICSQNVDSLHLRSGVPRSQLAELHGNCFAERCKKCKAEYVRDFEMDTVGFKPTGRVCSRPGCGGPLLDHILDWEDALPPAELKATEQHGSAAGLALCLGTSLQIIPAANLPLRTLKAGGGLAIVNLQATPKDKRATLVIHAKVDEVMAVVMARAGVPIPRFVRTDRVLLAHKATMQQQQQQQQQQQAADDSAAPGATGAPPAGSDGGQGANGGPGWSFELSISSVHGQDCPLPMLASAQVAFYGRPPSNGAAAAAAAAAAVAAEPAGACAAGAAAEAGAAAATATRAAPLVDPAAAAAAPVQAPPVSLAGLQQVLPPQQCSGQPPWRVRCSCPRELQEVVAVVQLALVDAADPDKRAAQAHYTIRQPSAAAPAAAAAAAVGGRASRSASAKQLQLQQQPDGTEVFSFVTQVRDYGAQQAQLVAALQQAAAASRAAATAAAAAAAGGGSNGNAKDCPGAFDGDHDDDDDEYDDGDGEGSGDAGGRGGSQDSDYVPGAARRRQGKAANGARGSGRQRKRPKDGSPGA